MKLLEIACLLASVPLVAIGGEGLYHAARNRAPVMLTCQQFVEQPPRALWLRVTGCSVDYMNVGYQELNGRITALFFPVRLPGQPSAPAPLVAATRDPEALAIVQQTLTGGPKLDQESFLVAMLRIVTKLRVSREVEGYARSGMIDVWRTRATLGGLKMTLAPRFAVIDLHERPSFVVPAIETAAGVLLVGLGRLFRARRPDRAGEYAAAPAQPPASALPERVPDDPGGQPPADPWEPVPWRFPAIMLLNLEPSAGAIAIEHAPPIGSRADTAAKIRDALGDVEMDGDGHAIARASGWSLALDLGREEPVWTVTAHAHGEGSVAALHTLARTTGWRLFIPKLGRFVDPGSGRATDPLTHAITSRAGSAGTRISSQAEEQ
jgi:hypothetical protein